jgi:hypothetical protein
MNLYYTYSHAKPDGTIFYIGKGVNNRAYGFSSRNRYWKRVVAKYGKPTVQILAHWKTEQEAFDHEMLLIDCFKDMGYQLANITKGGDGVTGLKWSEDSKKKLSQSKTGIKFINRGATSRHKGDKLTGNALEKQKLNAQKARLSILNRKNKPVAKVSCLICKKIGGIGAMARFHLSNCKET